MNKKINNKSVLNTNTKLAQQSKENRIINSIKIRAGNQQHNNYQQQYNKLIKIPQKKDRINMNYFSFVPVKRVDNSDNIISG